MQKIHIYSLRDITALGAVIDWAHKHNVQVDKWSWRDNCRDFYLRVPLEQCAQVERDMGGVLTLVDSTWALDT
jgi:hypothetical protein